MSERWCALVLAALSSGAGFEFGVAPDGDQDGSHLVTLGEDDLLDLTGIQCVEQAAHVARRFADGRELGVGDPDPGVLGRNSHTRDATPWGGRIVSGSSTFLSGVVGTLSRV